MFCFETAVKLLYWSGFVYEDDEVTSQTDVCLGVARKGLLLLYWSGFVYEDDEVLCKIAMCLKLVTMLGVTTERVMCCCAGVDLCVNNTMR